MCDNEDRKTCFDCEYYDSMPGNVCGVCIEGSFIGKTDSYLKWIYPEAQACGYFKDWLSEGRGENNAS